jgi:hypothetical protein
MVPDRQSGILLPPGWLTADVVRSPAATIGCQLAFHIGRSPVFPDPGSRDKPWLCSGQTRKPLPIIS